MKKNLLKITGLSLLVLCFFVTGLTVYAEDNNPSGWTKGLKKGWKGDQPPGLDKAQVEKSKQAAEKEKLKTEKEAKKKQQEAEKEAKKKQKEAEKAAKKKQQEAEKEAKKKQKEAEKAKKQAEKNTKKGALGTKKSLGF